MTTPPAVGRGSKRLQLSSRNAKKAARRYGHVSYCAGFDLFRPVGAGDHLGFCPPETTKRLPADDGVMRVPVDEEGREIEGS